MSSSIELFNEEMQRMHEQIPESQIPPNCYQWMEVSVLNYESRSSLMIAVPVTEQMLNPMRVMQGGFITAAFDNAFGPLSYVAARNPCTTLDLHTQYIRPIAAGDTLTVTARVISRGPVSLHLAGEAHNSKGKLVSTCTANMIVMK